MIRWTVLRPLLIAVFTEIALDTARESSGFTAEWKDGRRGFTSDKQKFSLFLKITTVAGIGEDENRLEFVPGNSTDPADAAYLNQYRPITVGLRRVSLQVQAHVPEHVDDIFAIAVCERVASRLASPSVVARFLAANVAFTDVLEAKEAGTIKDAARHVNVATLDTRFMCTSCTTDPVPIGWIEALSLTSDFRVGESLPAPPNVVNDIIPTGWTPSS